MEPFFKGSKILPPHDLVKYFQLLFMFDYKKNSLSISLENLWWTNTAARNDNSTLQLRNDFALFIPFLITDSCCLNFLKSGMSLMTLVSKILLSKTYVKSSRNNLISMLSDVVTCNRLL
jgi:hypothetical protein